MELKEGYKQTEVGVIPEDWDIATLGNLSQILRGGSPRPIEMYLTRNRDGYSWIKIGDVAPNAKYIFATEEKIIREGRERSRFVHKGDFLLSNSMSFGRPYILQIDGCIHDGWLVIQSYKDTFDTDFLYYLLCSEQTLKQYKAKAAGSGVLNLNKELVASVLLGYPTKSEQKAIASTLSDVDALLSSLDALIAKKRDIKKGAMQELLTGKKRLPGFSGEWTERCISDIAELNPESLSASTPPDYTFKYIALEDISVGNLVHHSKQNFSSSPSRARRIIKEDDILVGTVRPNLKSHFLVNFCDKDWICSTGFCVVRCNIQKALPKYIYYHFFEEIINKQIDLLITGSNYPAISSTDVGRLVISFPADTTEQAAIAAVLSDMDAEITALETRRAKVQALKQGMMQELLTGRTRLLPEGEQHG